jgi:hypothetical protein
VDVAGGFSEIFAVKDEVNIFSQARILGLGGVDAWGRVGKCRGQEGVFWQCR